MKPVLIIAVLLAVMSGPTESQAEIVFIGWGAPAELRIQVGSPTGITTVVHSVAADQVGDAAPVAGSPNNILIDAYARMPNIVQAWLTRFIISVDSSMPLSNGSDTIAFSNISWTSRHGDIPSGSFNASAGQVILGPTRAFFRVRDWLTFYYNNSRVVPSGNYTGRVTYTIAIP